MVIFINQDPDEDWRYVCLAGTTTTGRPTRRQIPNFLVVWIFAASGAAEEMRRDDTVGSATPHGS